MRDSERQPETIGNSERHAVTQWDMGDSEKHQVTTSDSERHVATPWNQSVSEIQPGNHRSQLETYRNYIRSDRH